MAHWMRSPALRCGEMASASAFMSRHCLAGTALRVLAAAVAIQRVIELLFMLAC